MSPNESDADAEAIDFQREHVLTLLVSFVSELRNQGITCQANTGLVAAESLAVIDLDNRDQVYAAMKSAIVSSVDDIGIFNRNFPAFWNQLQKRADPAFEPLPEMGRQTPRTASTSQSDMTHSHHHMSDGPEGTRHETLNSGRTSPSPENPPGGNVETTVATPVYSPVGSGGNLSQQPSTEPSDELLQTVSKLGDVLATELGRRRSNTYDDTPDIRRALRQSVMTGGSILSIPTYGRRQQRTNAILFVDVSRSVLDTIDRSFLLKLCWAFHHEWRSVKTYFFDTDIREVTSFFNEPTLASAADALEAAETEWGGGTRIGHAIDTIRRTEPAVVDRDTVVCIISDGLEVEEIDLLEDSMAWLYRNAFTVYWLNPLAASSDYEPICRGMNRSLPYVDGLVPLTSGDDLSTLTRHISRFGTRGPIGHQYPATGHSTTAEHNQGSG